MLSGIDDPVARSTLRMVFHFRRYLLLYVVAIIGGMVLILLPTVEGGTGAASGTGGGTGAVAAAGTGTTTAGAGQPGAAGGAPGLAAAGQAGALGGTGAAAAGAGGAAAAASSASASSGGGGSAGPLGTVEAATGTTAGGFKCASGVAQIPWSTYAPPCVANFTGNNGGSTTRGVTA